MLISLTRHLAFVKAQFFLCCTFSRLPLKEHQKFPEGSMQLYHSYFFIRKATVCQEPVCCVSDKENNKIEEK